MGRWFAAYGSGFSCRIGAVSETVDAGDGIGILFCKNECPGDVWWKCAWRVVFQDFGAQI